MVVSHAIIVQVTEMGENYNCVAAFDAYTHTMFRMLPCNSEYKNWPSGTWNVGDFIQYDGHKKDGDYKDLPHLREDFIVSSSAKVYHLQISQTLNNQFFSL